jgi:hypothetical protein
MQWDVCIVAVVNLQVSCRQGIPAMVVDCSRKTLQQGVGSV